MTPSTRLALLGALPPLALHALAREVDASVGILLHTTLDLPGFVGAALGLVEPRKTAASVAAVVAVGMAGLCVLARLRARAGTSFQAALAGETSTLQPLYLRPALTLLALSSLALRPTFPYGFTLPVALTQDWALGQDLAALAALLAYRLPRFRIGAPRPGEFFFACFLVYALLVPDWARVVDGHPGNEPKYLRMAVALGHRLSLDLEGIERPMEEVPIEPARLAMRRACATFSSESVRLVNRLLEDGSGAFEREAITASRLARQTIRGKDGGVFHVLAPGPSLMLAPALRIDRALNLGQGTPGRLALTLLLWNALGAALATAVFVLARDASGRPGLSAALAAVFALLPPFLFYFFQFYPEMPGALLIAVALRELLFGRRWSTRQTLVVGLLVAALPWLHQKFLPVASVLSLMALGKAVSELVPLRALVALLLPQAISLYLMALYNFAITGSPRPDAMFLAWGPGGITSAHIGQGALGLLLDARYGILPYVALYWLAAGGVLMPGRASERLRRGLPAAAVYYVTVASADDWHGAVSNLGRYFMPVAPYVVALACVALARTSARRGAAMAAMTLAAISACHAAALWADPHAANDATRLLAKSRFADGSVYIPDLFIRSFTEGAPGLAARILVWVFVMSLLGLWLRRAAAGRGGASPSRALFGMAALVLACAFLLERWPAAYSLARFAHGVELRPGITVFVSGAAGVERGAAATRGGRVDLLVRSRHSLERIALRATGVGRLEIEGQPPLEVTPAGVSTSVALRPLGTFSGRRGVSESFYRQQIRVRTQGTISLLPTALETP